VGFGCGLSLQSDSPKTSVMNCRYQAEFNIEKNESTPRGHLPDQTPWRKSLLARIRRERPVLLAAILSALAALAAGMNKWVVLVLLLVMILTALFNEAPIIAAEPAALSVAPVAPCHESKCAPSSTISPALSLPGISPTTLKPVGCAGVSSLNLTDTLSSTVTGT
jgi:hypothetical protein